MVKDFFLIPLFNQRLKLGNPRSKDLRLYAFSVEDTNLFVVGWKYVFALKCDFLEQFFSRAKSGDPDFNVVIRHQPSELNHVICQVEDPDWLAHIQYENVRSLSHG